MITKNNKIQRLFDGSRVLYHTQDLAVLWNISNKNTLYTTIRRYIDKGILKKIYKGFYSTKPIKDVNPAHLGLVALHRFGYLSTESILVESGIIFQDIKYITLVSDISRRFEIGNNSFLVRKIKEEYLFNGAGIDIAGGIRKASPERAVADMLYFNSNYHFDAENRIDWHKVKEIKEKVYGSSK